MHHDFQRMEFLGDAVLSLVSRRLLMRLFPTAKEVPLPFFSILPTAPLRTCGGYEVVSDRENMAGSSVVLAVAASRSHQCSLLSWAAQCWDHLAEKCLTSAAQNLRSSASCLAAVTCLGTMCMAGFP